MECSLRLILRVFDHFFWVKVFRKIQDEWILLTLYTISSTGFGCGEGELAPR